MMSDDELTKIESKAKLSPMAPTSRDAMKMLVEIRRLRHMVKNHEDAATSRELSLRSVSAERDDLKRQKDRNDARLIEAMNFPPEIKAAIEEQKMIYGTAQIKVSFSTKSGKIEYSVIEPEVT